MTEFWKGSPRLEARLARVESILVETLKDPSYPLSAETGELILSGGKMLRPALVIVGSGFGKAGDKSKAGHDKIDHIAAALELLHTATLIHDDILDQADIRRGVRTIHTRFGTTNAILAGDWLFSASFRLVADHADARSARILARFVGSICSAEIRQDLTKFSFTTTKRGYMRTIAGKTAALFSLALHVGASEAKTDLTVTQALRRAGYDLGMAFQIIDDILDYESDDATLKKPSGNDIREGLCTLPLIYALETRARALQPLLSGPAMDDEKVSNIVALVAESGALEKARESARRFTARARKEIDALPRREAKAELASLVDKLLIRTY
jgi:heptaprenyl diphosphate synthase